MNLFEKAEKIQEDAKKVSKGKGQGYLKETYTIPFFKGTYRKARPDYTSKVIVRGKPLEFITGAFAMNYCACLACQYVCLENADIDKENILLKKEKKPLKKHKVLTTYLVNSILELSGFEESDFARNHKPYTEIANSLKAFAKKEKLAITVDTDSGLIEGLEKYYKDVLKAF